MSQVQTMFPPTQPMISPTQPMVQPKVPPMQIPTYVNSNQGPFSLPNYGGVPVFPHNTQVLILSQVPQVVNFLNYEIITLITFSMILVCHLICMLNFKKLSVSGLSWTVSW